MKYAVEIGSGAMIYIPSFINIGSGTQTLIGGIQIHRQHGDLTNLILSFQNKESMLKKESGILNVYRTGRCEIILLSEKDPQT
jgi:hypothetical protein